MFDLGRELYDRISGLGKNIDGLGKALTNAVSSYNRTVGSLESRVLVSARKLNELQALSTPKLEQQAGRGHSPGSCPRPTLSWR